MSGGLPARFHVSSSATISRNQMMPSVREWFDTQLAKDPTIAPCGMKHWAECNGVRSPAHTGPCYVYVKSSGIGVDIIAEAKSRLRKAAKVAAVELAA